MLPSEMPPLPLPLDPITLGIQKSSRTVELRRALRNPIGSNPEGHAFGGEQNKSASSLANEELKHFKESVQDSSKRACDRAKMFGNSISKLDKLAENLSSKKRQRTDTLSSERPEVNLEKAGNQSHGSTRDLWNQRTEQKPKSAALVRRIRTSVADGQSDSKLPAIPRQLTLKEKKDEKFPAANAPIRMEEKIRRFPEKMKRKRSVSAVSCRVMNSDVDSKQAIDTKVPEDSKLCTSDGPGFRSKSSGTSGVNKLNRCFDSPSPNSSIYARNDKEAASSPRDRDILEQSVQLKGAKLTNREGEQCSGGPNLLSRGKVSRAARISSIMVLDSSTNLDPSPGVPQDWEQPTNGKITAGGVANTKVNLFTSGTSPQPMAKWGGQRPHKKSRLRRASLNPSVTNNSDIQNSPGMTELGRRSADVAESASLNTKVSNSITLKIRKEVQNIESPADVSDCEESGESENGMKKKVVDGCEGVVTTHDSENSVLPIKNKTPVCEIGDGVRRQGRSGRGLLMRPAGPPMKNKSSDLMPKPPQSTRAALDRSKSKSGRSALKKLKDRKGVSRAGSAQESGSPELIGELDDHETLVAAANSARNSLNQACSSRFWKKMEPIFGCVSNDDVSDLKMQLKLAEEKGECMSIILGLDCSTLDVSRSKDDTDHSDGIQGYNLGQEAAKMGPLCDKIDFGRLYKLPSMFERVFSALIDDESEELYPQAEGKNLSPHASDESHCGSCNQMDSDLKDKDKMDSEVESVVEQNQKLCFLDRLSCNKAGPSCTVRNSGMSTSGYSNEHSFGDDEYSHPELGIVSEICSSDTRKLQQKELQAWGVHSPDEQYHTMSLDDRLMLELRSIDLLPETLPDLAEEEELLFDVSELNGKLYQKVKRKQKRLGDLEKAVTDGEDADRRKVEDLAMNKIVEMAYKRRMAYRGTNTTKASVRRVPNHVASAFIKRTISRCRKYEDTGISSFREPALQDILFSRPAGKSDAKSLDCVASNTLNEAVKHQSETKGSGAISSTPGVFDSGCGIIADPSSEHNSEKPGSSKVTSAFDSKSTAVSVCKPNTKTKQRLKSSSSGIGFLESPETASLPVTENFIQPTEVTAVTSILPHSTKEPEEEPGDIDKFALDENPDQDLGSLLNFDGLQDCDSAGLEVPPWDDFSSVMIL